MLTRDDILKMPAGREMDALVAERVMGWIHRASGKWTHNPTRQWSVDASHLPHYSAKIAAAWAVVEHFLDKGWLFRLWDICGYGASAAQFVAEFGAGDGSPLFTGRSFDTTDSGIEVCARCTAPLAICRAALLTTLEDT